MTTIKNTIIAALAVATLMGAGISFTAVPAQAGYHYSGGYQHPVCRWKWVRWHDGYRWHRKRKWVCN